MDMQLIPQRYSEKIHGVLSFFARLILHGTLNPIGHPEGMTWYLYAHHIRIFDYPLFYFLIRVDQVNPCHPRAADFLPKSERINWLRF